MAERSPIAPAWQVEDIRRSLVRQLSGAGHDYFPRVELADTDWDIILAALDRAAS